MGQGSSLKNPNLSNIRENLTEGGVCERMNPKNVYSRLYDNLMEDLRRREAFFDDEVPWELRPTEMRHNGLPMDEENVASPARTFEVPEERRSSFEAMRMPSFDCVFSQTPREGESRRDVSLTVSF